MKNEITKREVLEAVIAMVDAEDEITIENGKVVTGQDILDYANKTIAQLATKNEKAKERQAKNKAEDPIRAEVEKVLTNENQTIDEIVANIPAEIEVAGKATEVTKAKVVARLTALVKAGEVAKEIVKVEAADGNRKVMAYRLVEAEAEADAE